MCEQLIFLWCVILACGIMRENLSLSATFLIPADIFRVIIDPAAELNGNSRCLELAVLSAMKFRGMQNYRYKFCQFWPPQRGIESVRLFSARV